jgi:UDP-N-acetylglucosamine acyltransferase
MGPSSTRIHPTALISPQATLAPDVTVGAFALLEGAVHLGPGCVIGPGVHLTGPLTMGKNNRVYAKAVLGERPQHLHYRDEPTVVEIGDGNTFRENVTVHRGTAATGRTVIGSGNCFRTSSHVGHDCQVGDRCTLDINAMLGGHCVLSDDVQVGRNSAVHQFCRLGRLSVLEEISVATVDIPPFIVQQGRNRVIHVNTMGMRRAGFSERQIRAIRRGYHTLYLRGFAMNSALARLEGELGTVDVVRELLAFARRPGRGIGRVRDTGLDAAA